VLKDLLEKHNMIYESDLGNLLTKMFAKSQFFPDAIYGLLKLKKNYKTAIISNTDHSLIKITLSGMEDLFDYVVTAEDTGYYKPDENAFKRAMEIINVKKDFVLHVSSYPQYDLETAERLGIKNIMLDRYGYSWPRKIKTLDELLGFIL